MHWLNSTISTLGSLRLNADENTSLILQHIFWRQRHGVSVKRYVASEWQCKYGKRPEETSHVSIYKRQNFILSAFRVLNGTSVIIYIIRCNTAAVAVVVVIPASAPSVMHPEMTKSEN